MNARGYCPSRPIDRGPGNADAASPLPGPLPPQRSIHTWLPHPSIVTEARRLTRKVLDVYEVGQIDDAEIVVSELVTNAVEASHPDWTVTLCLLINDECVLVLVYDESDDAPQLREPDFDEDAGRGLMIVEQLSDGCGYIAGSYGGKAVWARIRRLHL